MLRDDISYELLTLIRGGYIADDERLDLRLLNALVLQYRNDYIYNISKSGNTIPVVFSQYETVDTSIVNKTGFTRLESTNEMPRIISNKYGPMINEISSQYVDEYPFTIVNKTHLRYSGNGKFNENILFITYDNDKLFCKSKNNSLKLVEELYVSAIYEDPEDVSTFDVETDDYPLDLECVNYIKNMFIKNDLKLLLGQFSDEINDADGEIDG